MSSESPEGIVSSEREPRLPSEEEVRGFLAAKFEGREVKSERTKYHPESGELIFLDTVLADGEGTAQYTYIRKGNHGKQEGGYAGELSSPGSAIDVAYFDADDMPLGGGPIAVWDEASEEWTPLE